MASWRMTGYYKCYHCMPDYFELIRQFVFEPGAPGLIRGWALFGTRFETIFGDLPDYHVDKQSAQWRQLMVPLHKRQQDMINMY